MYEIMAGILAIVGGWAIPWIAYAYCQYLEQLEVPRSQNRMKKYYFFLSPALPLLSEGRRGEALFYIIGKVATIAYIVLAISEFSPGIWEGSAGITLYSGMAILFGTMLILLSLIDFRTQLLPDIFTFPLIAIGLAQAYFGIFTDIQQSLIGASIGYGLFWGINTLFRIIRKKEGMGGGDFKLMAALGAWLGIFALPLILMVAPIMGILFAVIRTIFTGRSIKDPFPFGPALALGGLAVLYGKGVWFALLGVSF